MKRFTYFPDIAYLQGDQLTSIAPPRYTKASMKSVYAKHPLIKPELNAYIKKISTNLAEGDLLISANAGVGKTYTGIALMQELNKKSISSVYARLYDLVCLSHQKISVSDDSIDLNALVCYDLLIIDDVGESMFSEDEINIMNAALLRVVDARYSNCKPTAMLTGLCVKNIKKGNIIPSRIMDRLKPTLIELEHPISDCHKKTICATPNCHLKQEVANGNK